MNVRTPLTDPAYYHTGSRTAPVRIDPVVAGSAPAPVDSLTGMAWQDLRALAKRLAVPGYAKMKRPALEAAIRSAQEARNVGE